jgi:hypothetical protein
MPRTELTLRRPMRPVSATEQPDIDVSLSLESRFKALDDELTIYRVALEAYEARQRAAATTNLSIVRMK